MQRPRPFHEALAAINERRRDTDRVEFSDELRRLNAEQRLRELRSDEPAPTGESDPAAKPTHPTPPKPAEEFTEIARTVEHRYEVTHQSATGRLIDMLM